MSESISLSTFFISAVLMVFSLSERDKGRSRLLLGIFFGLIALSSFFKYVGFAGELLRNYPYLLVLPELTGMIIPVVVYLYVMALVGRPIARKSYLLMLILPVILLITFNVFFILTKGFQIEVFYVYECFIGLALLTSISYIIYIVLSFRAIRQTVTSGHLTLEPHVHVVLFWVRWLLIFLVFRAVMALAFFPLQLLSGNASWFPDYMEIHKLITAVTMLLATCLTAYYALRNPALFDALPLARPIERSLAVVFVPEAHKDEIRKNIPEEEIEEYAKRVVQIVEADALFLDPQLTVKGISDRTSIPVYKITQALNRGLGKNFNEFINAYRVNHAKKLLTDAKNDRLTIAAIASESGFASVGPFYTAFKKAVGCSPTDFRQQVRSGQVA
jgi:AraC-like DNA-binding protein